MVVFTVAIKFSENQFILSRMSRVLPLTNTLYPSHTAEDIPDSTSLIRLCLVMHEILCYGSLQCSCGSRSSCDFPGVYFVVRCKLVKY